MPRPRRFSYPRAVHHVTLRCNNKEFLFDADSQRLFLNYVQRTRDRFQIRLHNFCIMTNHVHLLFKVGQTDVLSKSMHWLSSRFSQHFNKLRGRRGHLWEGRFRSTIVEQSTYFLRCMAYVDLNPVRAKIAESPPDYAWSAHSALRDEDASVLDFHDVYLGLGGKPAERYATYMEIVAEEHRRPAASLATSYFAGSATFVDRMEKKFGPEPTPLHLKRATLDGGLITAGPRRGRGNRITL
jgi:REP-associated tyrosine transposase